MALSVQAGRRHHGTVQYPAASTSARPSGPARFPVVRVMRAMTAIVAAVGLCSYALPAAVRAPVSVAARSGPVMLRNPVVKPPFGSAAPAADTAGSPEAAHLLNDARRFDARPGLAKPFAFVGGEQDHLRALTCLAAAGLYEAGDDAAGERAVMQVVLNRVRHGVYPASVCGVVFQGSELSTGCQFTFTCDGAMTRRPAPEAWRRARVLAAAALSGAVDPAVGDATHYHADYVYPYWAPSLTKVAQVGAHVFYRFAGGHLVRPNAPEPVIERLGALMGSEQAEVETTPASLPAVTEPAFAAAHPSVMAGNPGGVQGDAILLAIDPAIPPGRWAMDALSRCAGKANCRVVAWPSPAMLEANRLRSPFQRDLPVFVFIRDPASHRDLALWDCSAVTRPDMRQCLPPDRVAVQRLLHTPR
ncbi:cell wall hydrolase [Novosphingobium sp. fls2-241-R2A-195]|uniref:cell wall hydrolase n=1 Tax=Novosphingobium sp. fls2-241-R2A-195 TaxID=3040296 RepID=UPI00254BC687|nr:cell wall hydrolase [Novosphingobium sp. fls2-241-R2A-195]